MTKIRENKTCHSTRQLLQRSINFRFFCLQYMWLRIGSLHEYPIPQNKARIGSIPIPGIGTRSFLTFLLDRTEACLRGSSSMTSSYHKMAPNQSITIRQGFATILWQLVAFFKKSTKVVKWQGFFFFFDHSGRMDKEKKCKYVNLWVGTQENTGQHCRQKSNTTEWCRLWRQRPWFMLRLWSCLQKQKIFGSIWSTTLVCLLSI